MFSLPVIYFFEIRQTGNMNITCRNLGNPSLRQSWYKSKVCLNYLITNLSRLFWFFRSAKICEVLK